MHKKLVIYRVFIFSIILLNLSGGCKSLNKSEDKKMSEKSIVSRLREIKVMENDKLDSLSKDIIDKSREDANELVNILHAGKDEESKKASIVLMSIGDLSITPLIESIDSNNADNYAWEMDIILSQHIQTRNKITLILNSMFLDKRQLKGPEFKGVVEEKPIPRRVCDEAYLMLRKLLAHQEDEEVLMANERMFLNMSNEEKDKEINRLKSSKEWISLSEKMKSEGEF